MSIISRLARWILKLPPAETYDLVLERDIKVPMPDGINLLADRYYPRKGGKYPLILVRSPYGRRLRGFLNGRLLAEHGFQVLVQSCRGTFGSGGKLDPHRQERADGLATIEWMKTQDWFPGKFVHPHDACFGPDGCIFVVEWVGTGRISKLNRLS